MRRRSFLAVGGATGVAVAMSQIPAARAAVTGAAQPAAGLASSASSATLRELAAKIGLRVGTAVIPEDLNTPAWTAILEEQFSVVTPGNAMKWGPVEPQQGVFDWSDADTLVKFAEAHGQLVRGHTLLLHNQLPDWLTTGVANGTISKSQLMSLLEQHIFTEVGRYKGRIWQWDVANEFFTDANPSQINPNDFWVSNLGAGIIPQAFKWAHEADPHALLFYDDYNIAGEDGTNAKSNAAYAWLQQMLDQGVPKFSQMMLAALAVPEVISFTVWGFVDADSWVPGTFTGEGYATIYDVNAQPKLAFYNLLEDLQLAASGAPRRVPSEGGL
jgi:endo-1,4-beta-xylanase